MFKWLDYLFANIYLTKSENNDSLKQNRSYIKINTCSRPFFIIAHKFKLDLFIVRTHVHESGEWGNHTKAIE